MFSLWLSEFVKTYISTLKQAGGDFVISISETAFLAFTGKKKKICISIQNSCSASLINTVGVFSRSPDLKWHSQIDALSFSLRSRGLDAFISSSLPSSKERKKLAPQHGGSVGLSPRTKWRTNDTLSSLIAWFIYFSAAIVCKCWVVLDTGSLCVLWSVQLFAGCTADPNERAKLDDFRDVYISWCLIKASLQSLRKFFFLILIIFSHLLWTVKPEHKNLPE